MLPRWLSTRESAKPPPQEGAAARWPLLATLAAPVFTGLATAWFLRGRGPALWSKKVRDVMVDEVVTIDPFATLADAARQMRDHNVGILPVIVDGELAGVITDRDLVVRALAEGPPRPSRSWASSVGRADLCPPGHRARRDHGDHGRVAGGSPSCRGPRQQAGRYRHARLAGSAIAPGSGDVARRPSGLATVGSYRVAYGGRHPR